MITTRSIERLILMVKVMMMIMIMMTMRLMMMMMMIRMTTTTTMTTTTFDPLFTFSAHTRELARGAAERLKILKALAATSCGRDSRTTSHL